MSAPRRTQIQRNRLIGRATLAVQQALEGRGFDPAAAQRYAGLILSRQGTTILANGQVKHNGRTFDAKSFADSPFARWVTGEAAKARNAAAITGDPNYLQAEAELGFQRDQLTNQALEQRRRAILDFGSGAYTTDPTLAAQAQANPFSITSGLNLQYQRDQEAARRAAAAAGTFLGGGLQSGMDEAGRVHAGQVSDANRTLQDLLNGLSQQEAGANQAYGLGLERAKLDTYNQLLSAGLIHAATPPKLTMGGYHLAPPLGATPPAPHELPLPQFGAHHPPSRIPPAPHLPHPPSPPRRPHSSIPRAPRY